MGTTNRLAWTALLLLLALAALLALYQGYDSTLRGEALVEAMRPMATGGPGDTTTAASAILRNYQETRRIAMMWSGLYWGFAWISAALSALAGLVLKLESFMPNEKVKKDIAATLTVTAAILVTVSTGGEFQRKWQANRTAAGEIEHLGYAFIASGAQDARSYLRPLSEILLRRHLAIVGGSGTRPPASDPPAVPPGPRP